MKTYLVGGAVRDTLLAHPVKDRDYVVVGETPAALLALGFKPVGKDFPVFLHPDTGEEYALARTERKTGRGHTAFAVVADPTVTLADNLARRDLTINAIAQDPATVDLVDPHGGLADLQAGVARGPVCRPVRRARVHGPPRHAGPHDLHGGRGASWRT